MDYALTRIDADFQVIHKSENRGTEGRRQIDIGDRNYAAAQSLDSIAHNCQCAIHLDTGRNRNGLYIVDPIRLLLIVYTFAANAIGAVWTASQFAVVQPRCLARSRHESENEASAYHNAYQGRGYDEQGNFHKWNSGVVCSVAYHKPLNRRLYEKGVEI